MAAVPRDIHDNVTPEEWRTRVDLAALYRMVAILGWDDLVFTHLTARVPGPDEHFLINPYGLMFEEVTASSLVKVNMQGDVLCGSEHPINPAGYVIHSAVHEARPDVGCVMHLHTRSGVAVSAQASGLLPISQQSSVALVSLSYHDYEGIALHEGEKQRLRQHLGENKCLILRNHGLLTVGSTIAEAFISMYILQTACDVQILAQSGGPLISIGDEILAKNLAATQAITAGQGGDIAWSGVLRKVERTLPGYDQ
jgi:ribulose-5-phosphate 4-epimerase/fuculose-1-phosphate aldolase